MNFSKNLKVKSANELQHQPCKIVLMAHLNEKSSDQPAHLFCLIRTIAVYTCHLPTLRSLQAQNECSNSIFTNSVKFFLMSGDSIVDSALDYQSGVSALDYQSGVTGSIHSLPFFCMRKKPGPISFNIYVCGTLNQSSLIYMSSSHL